MLDAVVIYIQNKDRRFSVAIETGRPGFNSRRGQWWDFFSLPARPERLWNTLSLLRNGYCELLPRR